MCLRWDLSVGSTLKMSIELPVTFRHHRDMTERLLKVTLNLNKIILKYNLQVRTFFFQVEICPMA